MEMIKASGTPCVLFDISERGPDPWAQSPALHDDLITPYPAGIPMELYYNCKSILELTALHRFPPKVIYVLLHLLTCF